MITTFTFTRKVTSIYVFIVYTELFVLVTPRNTITSNSVLFSFPLIWFRLGQIPGAKLNIVSFHLKYFCHFFFPQSFLLLIPTVLGFEGLGYLSQCSPVSVLLLRPGVKRNRPFPIPKSKIFIMNWKVIRTK